MVAFVMVQNNVTHMSKDNQVLRRLEGLFLYCLMLLHYISQVLKERCTQKFYINAVTVTESL